MTRFYGSVQGEAMSDATRQGRHSIVGHIRGWRLGVRVTGMGRSSLHGQDGEQLDALVVDLTGGSLEHMTAGSHGTAGPSQHGLVIISECENGARRVFVDAGQVTGVAYLHPCGCWDTREDHHEARCTREATA